SNEDEKMLEELWESAQRMESRINALETILDNEVADWRKRT
ncbi:MAG: envelope stress response membrane protein PspB, partial [Sphingomonadaceae bacterium]